MPSAGVETRISEALNSWLAGLVLSPALPIAWPNDPFTPTSAFLQPSLLPAPTVAMAVPYAGPNEYIGVYQVSVFYPAGQGMTAPAETASLVVARFRRGTALSRSGIEVRINNPPWL